MSNRKGATVMKMIEAVEDTMRELRVDATTALKLEALALHAFACAKGNMGQELQTALMINHIQGNITDEEFDRQMKQARAA